MSDLHHFDKITKENVRWLNLEKLNNEILERERVGNVFYKIFESPKKTNQNILNDKYIVSDRC